MLSQPIPLRAAIWSNVLLWSWQVTAFGVSLELNTVVTLAAAVLAVPRRRLTGAMVVAVPVALYGVVVFLIGPCNDYGTRVSLSVVVLLLLVWSIGRLAASARHDVPVVSQADAQFMLIIIVAGALIQFMLRVHTYGFGEQIRVGGLYAEPSHLALSASPLVYIAWQSGDARGRLTALISLLFLMLVAASSTLVLLTLALPVIESLGRIVHGRGAWRALFSLGVVALVAAGYALSGISASTAERIAGLFSLDDSTNLSSLVYINGWQMLSANWLETHGLGLGLNAMGCSPRPLTLAGEILDRIGLPEMNYNDGSFLLSKVVSELGVVGLALWAIAVWFTLRLAMSRRQGPQAPTILAALAIVSSVSIGGVLRSAGYFSGPVQLALLIGLVVTPWLGRWREYIVSSDSRSA